MPAIQVFRSAGQGVDGWNKSGHDVERSYGKQFGVWAVARLFNCTAVLAPGNDGLLRRPNYASTGPSPPVAWLREVVSRTCQYRRTRCAVGVVSFA
jgi:hypothetical protein